jgi:signal transduction histidine kinase
VGIWVLLEKGSLNLKGIRRKIILNYCIVIFLTVSALEILFIFYVRNYYYGSVEKFLLSKAEISSNVYNKYMYYLSFNEKARHIFENAIQEDTEARIQIINNNGKVVIDSYGFFTDEILDTYDVYEALNGEISIYSGSRLGIKNKIMSVSTPLKYYGETEGIIRYSISIEEINDLVIKIEIIAFIVGIGVVAIALLLSTILGRSIVAPITELKAAASEMAKGNFNVKAKKMSNDEIGELSETFNYMTEEIKKNEKLKSEFISSISHELRTPLTSIQGWSETLICGASEEEREIGLNIIQSETHRLIKIVEELLDFSRYQRNKIELEIQEINVEELLQEIVDQYSVKVKNKKIKLTLNVSNDIKKIKGDKDRLKQVLINLIENSYKFTNEGGYIRISTYNIDENFFIEVEDNGEGIEEENIDKVFQKFFKENTNKPGSGLGLSICNQIVKAHDGDLIIESEKGMGTKVIIKL